jgi:phage baseplate assembly protein W
MPLELVTSKQFKDISLSFVKNPTTGDCVSLSNSRAISRAVRNLVSTIRGERFFEPDIGCGVNALLFTNSLDENSREVIRSEIKQTIKEFEPRVELDDVVVNASPYDSNSVDIKITYRIIGISPDIETLEFVFQPLR